MIVENYHDNSYIKLTICPLSRTRRSFYILLFIDLYNSLLNKGRTKERGIEGGGETGRFIFFLSWIVNLMNPLTKLKSYIILYYIFTFTFKSVITFVTINPKYSKCKSDNHNTFGFGIDIYLFMLRDYSFMLNNVKVNKSLYYFVLGGPGMVFTIYFT